MPGRLRALVFLATVPVLGLRGQQFGEITGTITDATGAVVAGAQVTARNTATEQVRTASSNDAGNYSLPYLTPGNYEIRVEKSGFKVTTRTGVDVRVGDVDRIDFSLQIGEVSQQIEVTGGAPLLNTESVALGSVIESQQIVNLPLNGRDYLNLVTLSSNAVGEMAAGGGGGLQGGVRASTAISVAGQRLEYNHYTLDGVENTDPNFNSYIIHPSVDAIQEFKVQTGAYSAEFGRGASQINVNTSPGTNTYHFVAFEFLRNSYFDAKQWEQIGAKNPFRRNDYGFTLGGPVLIPKLFNGSNRLFFMSNFEALRDRTTSQVTTSVATDKMRAGNFSTISQTIYDPLSRVYNAAGQGSATPFPGNIIPAAQISPQAVALLNYYPHATTPGDTLLRNYIRQAVSPNDSTQFNQRIDWVESNKSSWFGRFSWGNDLQDSAGSFPGGDTITSTTVRQAVLANTRILSSSIVNETRFAWSQFDNDLVGFYANKLNVQSTLGISGLTASSPLAYGIPAVGLGEGVAGYGGVTPWVTRNDTFQGVESLSLLKGAHSIKFGGEIRRMRYNQWGNQKDVGEFDFDAQSTCNPANCPSSGFVFADFMVGLPSQAYRVLSEGDAMMRSSYYAGYFQDDWKVTRKLTFNLGLRYENIRPWQDKYNAMINMQVFSLGVGPAGAYILPNTATPIITRPGNQDFYQGFKFRYAQGQLVQSGDQYMGKGLVNPNNRNWGPRVGLAYNPAEHWSVRAGFAIFYVQDIGNIVFDMARNLGGKDGYVIGANQRTTYLSAPWITETASPLCPGWGGVCVQAPQIQANAQNNRTPYVDQYLLNVQRELTRNLVLEVGYLGNEGHHLDRFQVYNQAIFPSGPTDHSSIASRRPWPAYGPIQEVAGVVNSNYHALNGKLTQRLAKGLTYTVAFTWSKAIDGGSATRTNGGDTLWPNNSYTLNTMRGPSQFNLPRRFVASYVYNLPFGPGTTILNHGAAGHIVGGWQLGGILTLADGTPIQGSTLGDTANIGNLANYPEVTGVSPIPDNRSANHFFNAAAFDFTNPNLTWQPGNEGRDVLSTPGTKTLNASLARDIRIREHHTVNFRFEAFNATNHVNWNTPPNDPRSPSTFGIVTSAKTMRQLQFALKYSF